MTSTSDQASRQAQKASILLVKGFGKLWIGKAKPAFVSCISKASDCDCELKSHIELTGDVGLWPLAWAVIDIMLPFCATSSANVTGAWALSARVSGVVFRGTVSYKVPRLMAH